MPTGLCSREAHSSSGLPVHLRSRCSDQRHCTLCSDNPTEQVKETAGRVAPCLQETQESTAMIKWASSRVFQPAPLQSCVLRPLLTSSGPSLAVCGLHLPHRHPSGRSHIPLAILADRQALGQRPGCLQVRGSWRPPQLPLPLLCLGGPEIIWHELQASWRPACIRVSQLPQHPGALRGTQPMSSCTCCLYRGNLQCGPW